MGMEQKPVTCTPVNLTVRFGADALKAADPGPRGQQKAAEFLGTGCADLADLGKLAAEVGQAGSARRRWNTYAETAQ
jgi:hypothetical protein